MYNACILAAIVTVTATQWSPYRNVTWQLSQVTHMLLLLTSVKYQVLFNLVPTHNVFIITSYIGLHRRTAFLMTLMIYIFFQISLCHTKRNCFITSLTIMLLFPWFCIKDNNKHNNMVSATCFLLTAWETSQSWCI